MYNRRKISDTITGPATDALERLLKRPRTEKSTDHRHETFDFPELYKNLVATVDRSDEAFPSISWSFDDESDNDVFSYTVLDQKHPATHSFLENTKEVTNSMQRSKSFRTNLSDMSERPTFFNDFLRCETNAIRIPTVNEDEKTKIFPRISNARSNALLESDTFMQLFNCEVQRQNHADRFQNSVGLDVL